MKQEKIDFGFMRSLTFFESSLITFDDWTRVLTDRGSHRVEVRVQVPHEDGVLCVSQLSGE